MSRPVVVAHRSSTARHPAAEELTASTRTLVVAAHGTADPAGLAVLEELAAAVASCLPGIAVRLAYVDVAEPTLAGALADVPPGAVVVPLFLASGYHVKVDVPDAVEATPGALATPPLWPHDGVVAALADRVGELGPPAPRSLVLVGAGSSDAEARAEVAEAAGRLARWLGIPVAPAFLGGPGLLAADILDEAAAHGICLVSYLLAPGTFQTRLEHLAAEVGVRSTRPIGAHPAVVDVVVRRYRAHCG